MSPSLDEDMRSNTAPPRRTWLRMIAYTLVGLLALGIVFLGGFAAFSTHVARITPSPVVPDADAIIVLTGGEKRIDVALDLLKSGKGRRLLISGVHPAAGVADLQRVTGGDEGLFSCCIDLDWAALDTIGNAQESAKWVETHAWRSIIVVTNNYHMPRSLLELGRAVSDVELVPYPVVNSDLGGGAWMTNQNALRVLFTEYTKYTAAMVRSLLPDMRGAEPVQAMEAASPSSTR